MAAKDIDLKRSYRDHYTAHDEPATVDVPARPFLMIDGEGAPEAAAYQRALAALYPLAYSLRRAVKDATVIAYTVMPLEGLWWTDGGDHFNLRDRSNWKWTAMICQPDEVFVELPPDAVTSLLADTTAKKELTAGHLARIERFGDSRAAQVLHRGPYAEEGPTITRLHQFIDDNGSQPRGKHHEIYLTDPRKGDPASNRTIIRQPITP